MPKFNRYFLAPDADVSTVGGDLAVPVIPAAAPSVTEVILADPSPAEPSTAVEAIPKTTTKGPEDFGMESAEESSERAGLKDRARDENGKFVKAANKAADEAAKPVKPAAKPAVEKPTAAPKPAATPAPVSKVKIGDREQTAEEWAKEFADLKAKAETPAKPAEPAKAAEPVVEQTPAEIEAAQKERETNFINTAAERYTIPAAELDEILIGGEAGAKKLASLLATAEMRGRQFSASKLTEQMTAMREELAPILEGHRNVQNLMEESAFLGQHADIKDHPKGLETFRQVSKNFHDGYTALEAKVAAGTASKYEQGLVLQYQDTPKDQLQKDIAEHTRAALAKIPAAAAAPGAAKPAAKPTSPPTLTVVEKPLGGDRPGGVGTPRTESNEARLAREVNEYKGLSVG